MNKPEVTRQAFAGPVAALLNRFNVAPVLIDIGASGPHRQIWDLIALQSVLLRFDPDLREIRDLNGAGYRRAITINEAVTADPSAGEVPFYLTRSPYCSSTLEPDIEALSDYIYTDLFRVERKVQVKASALAAILARTKLDRVDWFKTDSQGTDLRLFNSLPDAIRSRVLCVEVEPGILDAYRDEDKFAEAHLALMSQGFWLASAKVCGTTRIRQSTLARLRRNRPDLDVNTIRGHCDVSPGWVEALYLRDLGYLKARAAPAEDYVVLWAFALMVDQWGYALDVALEYEGHFGHDEASELMTTRLTEQLLRPQGGLYRQAKHALKAVLPGSVQRWIKARIVHSRA